jgi:hypothetical protein
MNETGVRILRAFAIAWGAVLLVGFAMATIKMIFFCLC